MMMSGRDQATACAGQGCVGGEAPGNTPVRAVTLPAGRLLYPPVY